jgi:hypothetical protein
MMKGMAANESPPRIALAEQAYVQLKSELHAFLWVPGERSCSACATRVSWKSRPRPAGP